MSLLPSFILDFQPTSEVDLITRDTLRDLCFPTHTEALRRFFDECYRWWY